MARPTKSPGTVESVAFLWANRLAQILHDHVRHNRELPAKLEDLIETTGTRSPIPSDPMSVSIMWRLWRWEEMDGYHNWRSAYTFGFIP